MERRVAGDGGEVGLIRDLGLFDITMVGVGAMIGAGIFVLTGIAAGAAGPALILSFALNGVVTVFTAMVYAELGSAIPEAGGGYLWVKEGLPAWNAFLAGWMSWFAHAVAGSLYALGFGSYLELVLDEFGLSLFGLGGEPLQKVLAVAIAVGFIGINFKGVSETGKVGNLVTLGKVLILAIFVGSGLFAILDHPIYFDKFTPFAPEGLSGVLVAMGLTFIAFEGYEIIVQAGEEVENPRENIPKAVFLSLAIVIPIYILVAFTALGAVNPETGEATWRWLGGHAELGLAEAARQFMPLGTTLLLVAGLLATMSALNATTFSSTRVSFAMGRDRNLPDALGRIHERTRTPFVALLASGALIILMAVTVPLEAVAAAADVMFLLLFLQVNVAVITIRKKYGDKLDYGYLTPFFPIVPIIGIVTKLFLALFMFNYSPLAWLYVAGWILAGLVLYGTYASRREREKALTPVMLSRRTAPPADRFQVLVPIADPTAAESTLAVAARIARPRDGELVLLHIATTAPQTPLTGSREALEEIRAVVEAAAATAAGTGLEHESLVRLAHEAWKGIVDTVEDRGIEFVVMGWRGRSRHPRTALGSNIDRVFKETPANTVVVQRNVRVPADRILIPIAHPRRVGLLLAIGRLLWSGSAGGGIILLHVVPPDLEAAKRHRRIAELRAALEEPDALGALGPPLDEGVRFEVVEHADSVAGILGESQSADLMIVGSSQEAWLKRHVVGEIPYRLARRAPCPLIMVNQRTGRMKFGVQRFFQFFRELEEEPRVERASAPTGRVSQPARGRNG